MGGRITVESVAGCSWNRWPDGRGIRSYNVLAVVCSYHFDPNRTDAFSPQKFMDGRRSLIPSDYIGEQQGALSQVTERIDHPLLRARIADSCWYTNRKLHKMAEVASSSYLDAVNLFFTGGLLYQYESDFEVPSKVVDLIERAFAIYASTGKRKSIPDYAKDTFSKAYEIAKDKLNLIAFHRLSSLGQNFELLEWRDIAKDAESIGKTGRIYFVGKRDCGNKSVPFSPPPKDAVSGCCAG